MTRDDYFKAVAALDAEMAERGLASFGVTPPGGFHSSAVRDWMRGLAEEKGWTDLEWVDTVDEYDAPMARLFGRRGGT